MVNLLNEEIMAIRHTIVRKKKMMSLTPNSGHREQLKREIEELNKIYLDKVERAGDNI